MSGLIWVQTVCKSYQQATLDDLIPVKSLSGYPVKKMLNLDLDN